MEHSVYTRLRIFFPTESVVKLRSRLWDITHKLARQSVGTRAEVVVHQTSYWRHNCTYNWRFKKKVLLLYCYLSDKSIIKDYYIYIVYRNSATIIIVYHASHMSDNSISWAFPNFIGKRNMWKPLKIVQTSVHIPPLLFENTRYNWCTNYFSTSI